jgi:hypothetical protein
MTTSKTRLFALNVHIVAALIGLKGKRRHCAGFAAPAFSHDGGGGKSGGERKNTPRRDFR